MFNLDKIVKDYNVILVDLDNTLFNYTNAHNHAIQAVQKKFQFSEEDYEAAKVNIKKRDLGANHHKKELYFKNICETKNENFFVAYEMYKEYLNVFHENLLADRSMFQMLKNAKNNGKKVIAITNYYVIPQMKKLETTGYVDLIDHLITSEEFEVEKPNVKLLNRALELSGESDKSKVIMFGDSVVDDLGIYDIKYVPYNCAKLLISISGKSGAGKSTISKVLKDVLDASIIEGDGYHKYERGHKAWKTLTHYNPKANNLIRLGLDIKNIYQNISNIVVPVYNHNNGKFDSVNKLSKDSLDVVVVEGLHTLYEEVTGDYVKIKIFIDSCLADNQKILRDVKERNKEEQEVLESINQRAHDYEKYIQVQKEFANFIIDISEDEKCKITIKDELVLDFSKLTFAFEESSNNKNTFVYCNYSELNDCISEIMIELKNSRYIQSNTIHEDFLDYPEILSIVGNVLDAPGIGGNVSIKSKNSIILKSSGSDMKNPKSLCSVVQDDEVIVSGFFDNGKFISIKEKKKPTMEYSLHKLIKSKYVLHYHPVYVLPYLCSWFHFGENCNIIDYTNPGEDLSKALEKMIEDSKLENIIYLRNHGVIIHADTIQEVKELYSSIKKRFFKENNKAYTPDDYIDSNPELWLFREAMENIASKEGYVLSELSEENKKFLDNDPNEAYRIQITEKE